MTSREGRQTGTCRSCDRYIFQLTTSRGGRQLPDVDYKIVFNFSTHDLSWRSTNLFHLNSLLKTFSTHDLSWRSTYSTTEQMNSAIFQLTTSRGGRHIVHDNRQKSNVIFNSRPLVEVDSKTSQ